jgi:hypothetical protein
MKSALIAAGLFLLAQLPLRSALADSPTAPQGSYMVPFPPYPVAAPVTAPGAPAAAPSAPATAASPAPAAAPAPATAPSTSAIVDGGVSSRPRTSTRGAMHRLASLDKRIDQAAKEGRYTHEQARLLHRDIASIRLKLKKSANGSGPKLTGIEEGRLESGLRAQDQPVP